MITIEIHYRGHICRFISSVPVDLDEVVRKFKTTGRTDLAIAYKPEDRDCEPTYYIDAN